MGFDLTGFISETPLGELPEPVKQIAAKPRLPLTEGSLNSVPFNESRDIQADGQDETSPRRVNQLGLF